MGDDRWREEQEWPLRRASVERWYLHGSGVLATTTPGTADGCSTIAHDPADPVPTIAGATFLPAQEMATRSGLRDRRSVQSRDDVLVFESAPLRTRRELTGELAAEVWVALDRAGGDVVVTLSQVLPDGSSPHIADGVTRVAAGEPAVDGEGRRPCTSTSRPPASHSRRDSGCVSSWPPRASRASTSIRGAAPGI